MSFLIAQILGLLALSALLGGALVYWWTRRSFLDVSGEYAAYERSLGELDGLRRRASDAESRIAALEAENRQLEARLGEESAWRSEIQPKLAELKPVSLEPVLGKVAGLADAVGKIRPADLTGVEKSLASVSGAVEKIRPADLGKVEKKLDSVSAAVEKIRPADLSKVEKKLDTLSGAVEKIPPADLGKVEKKLDSVSAAVEKIRPADVSRLESGIAGVSAAVSSIKPTDLKPVHASIKDVDRRVAALRNADLSGVDTRVRGLTDAVNRLEARIKPQPAPDFSGIHRRLEAVEKALKERPKPAPAPKAKATVARKPRAKATRKPRAKAPRKPGGNLLASPSHGKPDNLQRISGIGPKLEKMLHGIGVYYFWQIAEWNAADVRFVDARLEVFKGRISRDAWVRQAGRLAREPGSAKKR